jgi:hypothetical protein
MSSSLHDSSSSSNAFQTLFPYTVKFAGPVTKAVSRKVTIRNTDSKPVKVVLSHVATLAQNYDIQVHVRHNPCHHHNVPCHRMQRLSVPAL